MGTATNDVGMISSPTGKQVALSASQQRFAIAVFISGSKAPVEMREKVMAEITSAVVQVIQ